jgi:purine-binding chemotaxis protein CheW
VEGGRVYLRRNEVMTEELEKSGEMQLVVFRVGKEEYGLDIQEVKEIIKMQEITEIPNAPEFIEGVINLRGQITPVMDMRKRLNAEVEKIGKDTRIVIVETEESNIGIIVDSVTGVIHMPERDISPPPVSSETEFVKGVGKINDKLLILIDINKMMPNTEKMEVPQMSV